jgi:hypothetical protein
MNKDVHRNILDVLRTVVLGSEALSAGLARRIEIE